MGSNDLQMLPIEHPLFTQKLTKVCCEDASQFKYNGPHHFVVRNAETGGAICRVNFQEGPVKECGINGVFNEDLLLMVLTRLTAFQSSEFACEENARAIKSITDAVVALRDRTNRRIASGVQGTNNTDSTEGVK